MCVRMDIFMCRLTPPIQTELAINTHTMVADIRRGIQTGRERAYEKHHPVILYSPPTDKER